MNKLHIVCLFFRCLIIIPFVIMFRLREEHYYYPFIFLGLMAVTSVKGCLRRKQGFSHFKSIVIYSLCFYISTIISHNAGLLFNYGYNHADISDAFDAKFASLEKDVIFLRIVCLRYLVAALLVVDLVIGLTNASILDYIERTRVFSSLEEPLV